MRLTLHEDQAPIYRFPVSDMRDEAQRSEELAAAEDIRDAKGGAEELEDGIDLRVRQVCVPAANPCACLASTDLERGVIRVVVSMRASLLVFACEVDKRCCVEHVLLVRERGRMQD